MVPTLSSHGPFDIKEEYRELDLPKDLDETKLGGYFQVYIMQISKLVYLLTC